MILYSLDGVGGGNYFNKSYFDEYVINQFHLAGLIDKTCFKCFIYVKYGRHASDVLQKRKPRPAKQQNPVYRHMLSTCDACLPHLYWGTGIEGHTGAPSDRLVCIAKRLVLPVTVNII